MGININIGYQFDTKHNIGIGMVWNEILISVSIWLKNPVISIGMILVIFGVNVEVWVLV